MMEMNQPKSWSSQYVFLLASIGSTVGLSNIWKFTYLAGENGGGAFVIVYLLSLIILGIPILAAEMMIGKRGGASTVGTFNTLHQRDGLGKGWKLFGWVAMVTVFLILSFYCVIAGWTFDYTVLSLTGQLSNLDTEGVNQAYTSMLNNPLRMMISQGIFVFLTTLIVARGIKRGLESSIRWMMPALFFILIALMLYGMIVGEFIQGFRFLFYPDFSQITPKVVLAAFGQAFFSLGIGVGVMLTYGAYMPKNTNVLRAAAIIAFSDGLVAILAGMAIFPIVFQYNLSPAEGPGLIFLTLPITFGSLPGGGLIGSLFFLLLFIAALTSSISLLESIISHLEEIWKGKRTRITILAGLLLWFVGLGTVFSFNYWREFTPLDFFIVFQNKTIFGLLDYFGSNILMPLGGILMAIIAGCLLTEQAAREEMNIPDARQFTLWRLIIRYLAPGLLWLLFLYNL
jgi:neurotransmitter:Na+ symporter, NSS family